MNSNNDCTDENYAGLMSGKTIYSKQSIVLIANNNFIAIAGRAIRDSFNTTETGDIQCQKRLTAIKQFSREFCARLFAEFCGLTVPGEIAYEKFPYYFIELQSRLRMIRGGGLGIVGEGLSRNERPRDNSTRSKWKESKNMHQVQEN